MPIAAARPPRPAPTMPTWILGLVDMAHYESYQVRLFSRGEDTRARARAVLDDLDAWTTVVGR